MGIASAQDSGNLRPCWWAWSGSRVVCHAFYWKDVFRDQTLGWARGKEGLLRDTCADQNPGFPPVWSYSREACYVFLTYRVWVEEATPRWDFCCWGLEYCPWQLPLIPLPWKPLWCHNCLFCFRCPALQPLMHTNSLDKLGLPCVNWNLCVSLSGLLSSRVGMNSILLYRDLRTVFI